MKTRLRSGQLPVRKGSNGCPQSEQSDCTIVYSESHLMALERAWAGSLGPLYCHKQWRKWLGANPATQEGKPPCGRKSRQNVAVRAELKVSLLIKQSALEFPGSD